MPRLMIVIASTRPGRGGEPVARWLIERAGEHGAFELTVVDLAEFRLPLLDEPNHPRLRQYTNRHTHEWSEKVDGADAFVFVTPEYNHGYPASLKNAIDYLHNEWRHKPVGFVSYGGVAAGTRSVEQLQQVVVALRMTPVIEQVNIPFYQQFLGDDGVLRANEVMEQAADTMLDRLQHLEQALRPLRDEVASQA
ncbi:MAG: NAD(P)H-dependent oxidoreductase [Solirubrobacterales bacterium]|nr:NAD(P)H-dependent oxidoreductase [Solirubrobacterales bacterium]